MKRVLRIRQLLLRSKRLPWWVTGATTLILAGAILATTLQLRVKLRAQIVGRDGAILRAVALMQLQEEESELENHSPCVLADPAGQFALLMRISRLSGMLGARLYDSSGRFVAAFPAHVLEAPLPPGCLDTLRRFKPASHFYPAVPLSEVFLPLNTNEVQMQGTEPLLVVSLPLHHADEEDLAAIGQFIIAGHGIASEFAKLDRRLALQAGAAFLVSSSMLAVVIAWSFRRLRRAHGLLAARTNSLLKANQELALAAKTSALGALTAHLIHGLSNPLSGLQNFVASRGQDAEGETDREWQEALASTRRMQALIGEIVRLLGTEDGTTEYEMTLGEMLEVLLAKAAPMAQDSGVILQTEITPAPEVVLSNRRANLIILILENLLQNAIQASRSGQRVTLTVFAVVKGILCRVKDEGPGLPEHLLPKLFMPCRSTKATGSGIGLAISKQLANHLGASLGLHSTSPAGSVFELWLPEDLWTESPSAPAQSSSRQAPEVLLLS